LNKLDALIPIRPQDRAVNKDEISAECITYADSSVFLLYVTAPSNVRLIHGEIPQHAWSLVLYLFTKMRMVA